GGALRRGEDPIAAQTLDLVESGGKLRAAQGRGRRHPELVARLQNERSDGAPVGAQRERVPADRVLLPLTRRVARHVIDADARLDILRAVIGAECEDRSSRASSESDAVRLRGAVVD